MPRRSAGASTTDPVKAAPARRVRQATGVTAGRTADGREGGAFLELEGIARRVHRVPRGRGHLHPGRPVRARLYIQKGSVKLSVLSKAGREAVVAMLGAGEFFGEGCLAGQPVRMGSATATTDSTILLVDKDQMVRLLHKQHALSDRFIAHMLARNIRIEEDLIDQLFNSSEKRLARTLLLLARYGKHDKPVREVPPDLAGDAGRDGRHDAVARQLLHEEVPAPRVHRLHATGSRSTTRSSPSSCTTSGAATGVIPDGRPGVRGAHCRATPGAPTDGPPFDSVMTDMSRRMAFAPAPRRSLDAERAVHQTTERCAGLAASAFQAGSPSSARSSLARGSSTGWSGSRSCSAHRDVLLAYRWRRSSGWPGSRCAWREVGDISRAVSPSRSCTLVIFGGAGVGTAPAAADGRRAVRRPSRLGRPMPRRCGRRRRDGPALINARSFSPSAQAIDRSVAQIGADAADRAVESARGLLVASARLSRGILP